MERHLKIASPCSANWDQMVGDNRIRHCAVPHQHRMNGITQELLHQQRGALIGADEVGQRTQHRSGPDPIAIS